VKENINKKSSYLNISNLFLATILISGGLYLYLRLTKLNDESINEKRKSIINDKR